jgi:hypothetical protein
LLAFILIKDAMICCPKLDRPVVIVEVPMKVLEEFVAWIQCPIGLGLRNVAKKSV